MKVHPAIAALRKDDAPHRLAQAGLGAAFDGWCHQARDVLADLPRLAERGRLDDAPALARLFMVPGEAASLVEALVSCMAGGLRDHPLGHVPLRHATDGVTSTLMLGRCGPVTLALSAVDGAGWGAPPVGERLSLAPLQCWDLVLAGKGEARLVSLQEARDLPLAPGVVSMRDGRVQALHLQRVEGCLVWLRLQWRDAGGGPVRLFDRATGAVIAQSAATMQESRQRVMVDLLGQMGHAAAAATLARMALEEGAQDLRWAALRRALALDTRTGFEALLTLAEAQGDPLQRHASTLRDHLLARHPELEGLMPCPA